jgi:hypothetical protein
VKTNKLLFIFVTIMALIILKPSGSQAADVVDPKQTYTYNMMVQDIRSLADQYPELIQYKIIGYSEYKKPIYAVSLGTGNATVFINGSHHAREWISTTLNMYMLEQYAKMYKSNHTFGGYDVKKVLDETTIWFVPMVNPDGVTLQQVGLKAFPVKDHASLIRMNDGSSNFKKWKANAKGVDLNRQYDADWKNIKNNFSSPRWSNHKGYFPEQATETKAMVSFTKEIDPEMAIAYHTSGEILYWNFHQSGQIYARDEKYAKRLGQLTSYRLVYPGLNPSGGGYTDWFVSKYKRPGFTPELARYAGNTNVPLSEFSRIWSQNKYIGLYTASESYKLYLARGGKPNPIEVNVKIDGKLMAFDQPALLVDGNTVVPLRGVFENLGAAVEWDQNSQTILARKGTTLVELKVGSKSMKVNGESKKLTVAPQMINNRTMIPLRAVSEALGATVGWDGKTTTALITSLSIEKDVTPPQQPEVDRVTDVTKSVTGTSETNALIEVKKEDEVIGKARADANGQFSVEVKAQNSDTILTILATDLAGNTSEGTQVTVQYTNTFTDTVGHWSEDSIGILKDRNITNGLPDGSFGINQHITRSETTALLARALKLELKNNLALPFSDVSESHYYYESIAAIYEEEIMQGKPGGVFEPDSTLTRAEMATILANAYDLEAKQGTPFPDVETGHWGYEAIHIVASNGLAGGYPDGTFRPDAPITRAEFGALLARVILNQEKEKSSETDGQTDDQPTTQSGEPPEKQTEEPSNDSVEENEDQGKELQNPLSSQENEEQKKENEEQQQENEEHQQESEEQQTEENL